MFSVIMPVWNRSEIVEKAIKSVLSQTFEDYELIIIDDGSEDNLEKIIRPYVSKKVRYYRIPHSGVSVARNEGIKYAKGDFLAYLDSDNVWHPEFLSVMHDSILKSKAEAAYCKYNVYRKYPLNQKIYLHHIGGEEFNYTKLLDANYIDLNAFIHTRKSIEDEDIFDIQLRRFVDWDLILRITSKYDPVFVQSVLVDYYLNVVENTITLNEDTRAAYDVLKRKYHTKKNHKRSITIEHDAIEYLCDNVPERKYNNWMMMNLPEIAARARTINFGSKGYPYMLQIEPTNICNLSCPLCPTGRNELNRQPRHMKFDEFKAVIDDMEEYLLFLVLWSWGEPFMNPELPEMIRYASERGIKTVTSTNAHFLHNEEYLKKILRSGLSNLIVAIDSLDEKNYTVYKRKGELDKIILGLKNLIRLRNELKSGTKINLRMVVMKQNENEISEMREFAKNIEVDVFSVKTVNPSCGLTPMDEEILPSNPKYRRYRYKEGTNERIRINTQCTRIWHMSNIASNGDVVPCCYDYDSELKVGNIHEKPFSEIWNSLPYRNLRKKIYYEKDSIPKCRECTINFELSNLGRFVESHDFNVHNGDMPILGEKLQERENQVKQLNEVIADLNNSITLRFARKIPFGRHIRRILMRDVSHPRTHKSSWIKNLHLPLEENHQSGWKSYHVFRGSTRYMDNFSCHVSVLGPGKIPHEVHSHPEEELAIMLSGKLEVLLQDPENKHTEKKERIEKGDFIYYNAFQPHTIHNVGTEPATYIMFKWCNEETSKNDTQLETTVFHYGMGATHIGDDSPNNIFHSKIFENPTNYLQNLHCHVTALHPDAGYSPHPDEYDVVILMLSGIIETLGRRVEPHSVIFYSAGEPHGIKNIGDVQALYLVLEFHNK